MSYYSLCRRKLALDKWPEMHLQTNITNPAAFDEIYAKVPLDQVAALKNFRLTHPYKRLTVGDTQWQYISC